MGIPTFDIEAIDWTEPIAVGFTDGENYREFLKETEDTDVIWAFLKSIGQDFEGISVFAHNAGNYDNKFILDSLVRHKQKIRLEAGLGRVVWLDKDIVFEDSLLVVGTSLATLCKAFKVPRKLDWDHKTTRNIWEMGNRLDSFKMYLKRDVMSLSMAMEEYCKSVLQNFGVTPSATLSLTAVKAFSKNFYPVSSIKSNEEFEPFIREAVYGARNEVYKRRGEGLYLYDIRSMYISCYDSPIPIGDMHWCKPKMEHGTLAEALVEVPTNMNIGPLPHRWNSHLIFPVGKFPAKSKPCWWDMVELRNAEELGVKVKLLRQLECEEAPILKEFGEYVSLLRYSSNIELGKLWKLFGIRVSGKFGQHRWRTEICHESDIEDFTGYTPMDASEVYHERSIYLKGNKAPYVKPAVVMRIRAEARIRHLKYLLQSDPYYGDTDSVHTTTQLPIGENSGELQLVGLAKRAYYIRPKLYGFVDHNGHMRQRAAGFRDFRLTEYDFQNLLDGKDIDYVTKPIGKWKDILASGGLNTEDYPRRARGRDTMENRIVDGLDTYPIKLPVKG